MRCIDERKKQQRKVYCVNVCAILLFRQVVQQKACDVNHFIVLINVIFIITVVRKEEKRSVFDGHMETEQFCDVIVARAEHMSKTRIALVLSFCSLLRP